jgi:hypothetical protein
MVLWFDGVRSRPTLEKTLASRRECCMPDFTVIEGGGSEGRDRIRVEQEFEFALREAAANMLRIIRGAGKSYALLKQLSDVVSAAVKVQDVTGRLPTDILETVLRRESETEAILEKRRAGEIDEASIERWHEDGTFDRQDAEDSIKAGVLQMIASQFVGQVTQKCAGQSEMRNGINKVFAATQKAKQYRDAGQRAPRAKTARKKRKHNRGVASGLPRNEPSNH